MYISLKTRVEVITNETKTPVELTDKEYKPLLNGGKA
jgi:hypothetical protein